MQRVFSKGQAVYFRHLHDDLNATQIDGPDENGEFTFEIEGKIRRMIVLGRRPVIRIDSVRPTGRSSGKNDCKIYSAKRRLFYVVVSVSSKPPPRHWLRFEGLLECGKDSYIDVGRTYLYPVEFVEHWDGQSVRELDDQVIGAIMKQLTASSLGLPETRWGKV